MVSVVIPCFNHGEFLPETIASVVSLKGCDIEIIIVDDGSTDEQTRERMDELAGANIQVIRQENKGPAAARNTAIAASRGEYIFPLDADDRLRPGWIDRGIRMLESNSQIGVVYGDAQCFGMRSDRWTTGLFDPDRLLQWNYIHASALYRRTVWEQNRGYDVTKILQGYEDWDFWLGALEHGWEFAYMREVFFDYRQAEESMTTRAREFVSQMEAFVASKHGLLYRRRWQQQKREHESVKGIYRDIGRLIESRSDEMYTVVRLKIAKELRLIRQRFERHAS